MELLKEIESFFERPRKVFYVCLFFLFATFILDGSMYQLWSLYSQQRYFEQEIVKYEAKILEMDYKIEKSQSVEFIERQALDQLELVAEGDLVFVFSDGAL